MKVSFYIPRLDSGGPDRVFYEVITGLNNSGFSITLITDQAGGRYWSSLDEGIRKVVLDEDKLKTYPVSALAKHLRNEMPAVLICTLNSILTATLAKASGRLNVPLVIRPANHLSRNAAELIRQSPIKHSISWLMNVASLYLADHIICQSQDLYDDFRRYGLSKNKLSIIGNPIRLPASQGIQRIKPQNVGSFRLVAVGRLSSQKAFDILIKAITLLREDLSDVTLEIFGDGPDKHFLSSLIVENNLSKVVFLRGHSAKVAEHVANADFLVSSSRYEGFPNVVLEALSYGVPVIATDCPGGTREMVEDGVTGFLCQPESPQALAAAIEKAYFSPKFSPEAIRSIIKDKFAAEKIIALYSELIRRVIAKKSN